MTGSPLVYRNAELSLHRGKLMAPRQATQTLLRPRLCYSTESRNGPKFCIRGQAMSQTTSRLTDAMVAIEGENLRPVTWVKVDEIESGDWGIGGQALTTEAVKALAGGKTPVAAG